MLIEEAHHILLRKKQELSGEEAVTDIILREIRELGESIVLLDQHPSLISKPALGNTYLTVVGNLKHRSDISMIADSLLLDSKQARFLGKLDQGWAMVRLQGRWFEPFLVRFPLVKVRKGSVSDEDVHRAMEGFMARVQDIEERSEKITDFRIGSQHPDSPDKGEVPKNAELLLKDVHRYPVSSVTERYERIGLNTYQGNRAKEWLTRETHVIVRDLSTGKARIRVLELTDKGKKALEGLGEHARSHRKGGPEHEYWKKRLAEEYRSKGWRVVEEYPIGGGKTVDLACFKDGRRIAVEVETGKSYSAYNLKKCMEAGFDEVRSVKIGP